MKSYSFTQTYSIRTDEANQEGDCFLAAVGNLLQNTAHMHANSLSFGVADLGRDGKTWMLSRMVLSIRRPPRCGETVSVETWPTGIEKLFALREFCMTGCEGEELLAGTSGWLIVDVAERRIARIPEGFHDFEANPRALDVKLPKIEALSGPIAHEKSFTVRFRDIDINRHVNSIAYFEWITEALPVDLQTSCFCSRFEINYLKEAFYGDTIVSRAAVAEDGPGRFTHSLFNQNNEELVRARTEWITFRQ